MLTASTRRRRAAAVVGVVIAAIALIAAGVVLRRSTSAGPGQAAPAPAISGPTATGGHFTLQSLARRWVLVTFFASWCTDCRRELGQLAALERQRPSGLAVVSVDGADDSLPAAHRLIVAAGGGWPLVSDPGALSAYGVTGLPEAFLVDPDGRVVDRVFGTVDAARISSEVSGGREAPTARAPG